MEDMKHVASKVNWILLGLLMVVPGALKLFVSKPSAVVGMLTGLGFPAPSFFAWILILSEILFGVLILARWNLKYTTIPPMIIMVVAGLTVFWGQWPGLLLHLTAAANYWMLGAMYSK